MSALVCLTYDDALPVHRQVVAPLLAERGLRGTFYIPAARDDFHNHLEDWRKVAAMGHELGNHSCFHSCFHPCRTRAACPNGSPGGQGQVAGTAAHVKHFLPGLDASQFNHHPAAGAVIPKPSRLVKKSYSEAQ